MDTARLVLEDGTAWEGRSCGAEGERAGELVFFTGVVGYQEVVTDPAFLGSMVVMTYPHIGNYGTTDDGALSDIIAAKALVVKEASRIRSNWKSRQSLQEYAREKGIMLLSGVDTQEITRHIREHGSMRAVLSTQGIGTEALGEMARAFVPPKNAVASVGSGKIRTWEGKNPNASCNLLVLDLGVRRDFLGHLNLLGGRITLAPWNTTAEDILALNPAGIVVSTGPGNPQHLDTVVEQVRVLAGKKPLLGIGLGFQVLCRAFGAGTLPMKCGHYGLNQPVRNTDRGTCLSTEQAHRFTVDSETFDGNVEVTHVHLTDGSVEGFRHRKFPALGIQYCPEAGDPVLQTFMEMTHA